MKKIEFTKVVASGNDFVVIKVSHKSQVTSHKSLAKKICARKYGVGADGLLLLEKSKVADIKMRIFNADGSEAQMCGNGARCAALWAKSKVPASPAGRKTQNSKVIKIETKAGIIEANVLGENVKIKLTEPKDYKESAIVKINEREIKINSINTGVPHAVIFVEGIENINVVNIGREIRYSKSFAPAGTNVDFVEVINKDAIKVRTYERGVEDETLACGTGVAASAIVTSCQLSVVSCQKKNKIEVITQGGETLKVYFDKEGEKISNVWIEGKVRMVYKGEYYV